MSEDPPVIPLEDVAPEGLPDQPAHTPIDLERGRQVHGNVQEVLQEFGATILPSLPLCERTGTAVVGILQDVTGPGGVELLEANQARFAGNEEHGYVVEVAPSIVDAHEEWLKEAEERSGVYISDDLREGLATRWLI